MKKVIIKSSQLGQYNRWDAGFNIAISELSDEIKRLAEAHSESEARTVITEADLPLGKVDCLKVLARGSSESTHLDSKQYKRIIKEYPIESLALIIANSDSIYEKVKQERDALLKQSDSTLGGLNKMGNM